MQPWYQLRRLAAPTVRVRRDGRVQTLPARDLVPGHIVLLEAGDLVPADGRLLHSANLRVQESALTGEAEPIEKVAHAMAASGVRDVRLVGARSGARAGRELVDLLGRRAGEMAAAVRPHTGSTSGGADLRRQLS
jgi:magnesium-transporting ATPase (P-type)